MKYNILEKADNIALAKAQVMSIPTHKGKKYLFVDPDSMEDHTVPRFELSIPSLNKVISNRYFGPNAGFAMGKIYNFYGPESLGKSGVAMQIFGEMIAAGMTVLWVDKENSFDSDYALSFGIDIKDKEHFILTKPDNAEEAFDIVQSHIENNACHAYCIDSVTSLGTATANEREASKQGMGEVARKLSEHFPRIITKMGANKISGIYINQIRYKSAGVLWYKDYTGGNPMHFFPHTALEFKKGKDPNSTGDDDSDTAFKNISITAKKNKTAKPGVSCNFTFYSGEGLSKSADIIELGLKTGVIKKGGAWLSFNVPGQEEPIKIQGVDNLRYELDINDDLANGLLETIKPNLVEDVNETTGEILDEAVAADKE